MPKRTPTGHDGRDTEWGDDPTDPTDPGAKYDEAFAEAERDVPPEVPLYLAENIRELDTNALETLAEWVGDLTRRRKIEAANAADVSPGDGSPPEPGSVIEKYQKCGKEACACASGDESDMHGPYRYRVTTTDDGGRKWEYLGKA